jgi:hypothetical protein
MGFRAQRLGVADAEHFGNSNQICQRPRPHFFHDVTAVNLHGNLSNAKLTSAG